MASKAESRKVAFYVLMRDGALARYTMPDAGISPFLVFTNPFSAKKFVDRHGTGLFQLTEILASGVDEFVQDVRSRKVDATIVVDLDDDRPTFTTHPIHELYRYQGVE